MARRRKKGTKRRKYAKKRAPSRRAKATPIGATAGAAYGGAQAIFIPASGTTGSMFDALKDLNLQLAMTRLPYVVKDKDVYRPIIGGLIVSAAPSLPLVKLVAKPIDRAVRKVTKGKASL